MQTRTLRVRKGVLKNKLLSSSADGSCLGASGETSEPCSIVLYLLSSVLRCRICGIMSQYETISFISISLLSLLFAYSLGNSNPGLPAARLRKSLCCFTVSGLEHGKKTTTTKEKLAEKAGLYVESVAGTELCTGR